MQAGACLSNRRFLGGKTAGGAQRTASREIRRSLRRRLICAIGSISEG